MSDHVPGTSPEQPSAGTPTTVVGYPGQPASAYVGPGLATVQRSLRTVRRLLGATLALLLVVAVGLGALIVSLQVQLTAVSDDLAALAASPPAAAPAGQATAEAPAPSAAAVKQLAAAADLPAGTELPQGVDSTGAVLIGAADAGHVVEVYVDYQCPFCQRFEQQVGQALVRKALEPGSDLLVKQYNLAFLGETDPSLTPPGASARAAAAAACVVDSDGPEAFAAFSTALFAAADPTEPPGQFPTKQLATLAADAGASPAAIECIRDGGFVPFVAATTAAGFGRGVGGTPTVVLDGETLGNAFTDERLASIATATAG